MGTTVTTNLALIKPDEDESIRENLPTFAGWATQNAANCNKIDSLFRSDAITVAPTWSGSGGNPTLGAGGFVEGKVLRLWPKMMAYYFRIFTGGAGFAVGTGVYRINTPELPVAEFATPNLNIPVGKAVLLDASAVVSSSVMLAVWDKATNLIVFRSAGGNFWQPTNPITLAQNDRISGYAVFPTSAP